MKAAALPETTIRRWTRAEYDRLIDLGIFKPGERLELLDGWLVLREPQGTEHSAAIRRVLDVLRLTLGDTWRIDSLCPSPWTTCPSRSPTSRSSPRIPGTT